MLRRLDGTTPRVIAVTVTSGRRGVPLARVVEAALHAGAASVHVVFRGNGGQERVLRELLPADLSDRVSSTALPNDLGTAGGFGAGIEHCLCQELDYAWLLEDDTVPRPDALSVVLSSPEALDPRACHASLRETDLYQSQLVTGRPVTEVFPSPGRFLDNDVRRMLRRPAVGRCSGRPRTPIRIPVAPYGGLLVSRAALTTTAPPRPEFLLQGDDREWTRRITMAGFPIHLHPLSRIDDVGTTRTAGERVSATDALLHSANTRELYLSVRNRTYLDRELALTDGRRGSRAFALNRGLYCAALAARGLRWGRVSTTRTVLRGVVAGSRGHFLSAR
ncbi:glycosyltransferase [Rathayibacter sp. VKM Ac-2856]|uniref:glycosyltransferase n=1 Tax=unclassified Rathayibacter TaxID=2609250 RepID=UPI001567442A|nr:MULTISPECIES: glycosyltransferase [unclassified Rathayibacter]NQX03960.1 glycosyltransferase [Rathayibacter sp. VKM Ac-2858]NQX19128.1 glycosyltransferase [Rathayibacter sp. VKM Ac-2856]